MIRPARSLALGLVLLGAAPACRCGEPAGPRAYDVGVPLGDLPRAHAAALEDLVPGPVLLYAEAQNARELAQVAEQSAWFQSLQKGGGAQALALSGPAATLTALAQRLNDLSRTPIGEEALSGMLDGPLALAVRAPPRGGFELLLVKSVTPAASSALKLAQMLEAVHASAQEVVVERHEGLPVRALRLDASRRLYYVVLRDRLLLATDAAWLNESLELALGRSQPAPRPSLKAVRASAPDARALAVVDATLAQKSAALGASGRALSGLSWLALRWNGERVDLGARRAQGAFSASGGSLSLPPGTALALAREATLPELLEVPPPAIPDGGAPDPEDESGRALLQKVESGLAPALEGHVLYALARSESEGGEHLLALSTRAPGAGTAALDALAPQLFRTPPTRRDELVPGARCVGAPPAFCWAEQGSLLTVTTAPGALRAQGESPRALHGLRAGPLSLWLDAAELAALLAQPLPSGKRRAPSELDPLIHALRLARPLTAELTAAAGGAEAWGPLLSVPLPPEPKPLRDGGAP